MSTATDNSHVRIRFTIDESSSSDFSDGQIGYSGGMESTFSAKAFMTEKLDATQIEYDANGDPVADSDTHPGAILLDLGGMKNIESLVVRNRGITGNVKVVWTGPTEEQTVDANGDPVFEADGTTPVMQEIKAEQLGQSLVPPERFMILASVQDDSVIAVEGVGQDVPVEILIFGEK
ncbi:MAG: hypothetical protein CMJ20_06905 [Phycisphaeraceae bacterium]|nr:hypothetical protein [Phycisphaeraceae bacterium]|tara:strand:+ start:1370 stop:1900 length:531 start_codon:yes stop_codon:yes gene_type:complete